MIKREDDGIWVILRETIACHHDEVFACLTTAEGLSRWFPIAAKIDLKIGGEIVLGWKKDFSRKTTIASSVLETGSSRVMRPTVAAGKYPSA